MHYDQRRPIAFLSEVLQWAKGKHLLVYIEVSSFPNFVTKVCRIRFLGRQLRSARSRSEQSMLVRSVAVGSHQVSSGQVRSYQIRSGVRGSGVRGQVRSGRLRLKVRSGEEESGR